MKKISKIVLGLILVFTFINNYCFADVYFSKEEQLAYDIAYDSQEIFNIIIAILFSCIIISLTCLLISKIIKNEELFKRSKFLSDLIVYIILITIGFKFLFYMFATEIIVGIIGCIILIASLILRFVFKKKIISYIILAIVIVPLIIMLLPELKFMFI